MAHPCRSHFDRQNYHRHHSWDDTSNELDAGESMLLGGELYLPISFATITDRLRSLALVFDVSLGHRHAIRQRIAWRRLR